jgi:hypothetical protein
MIYRLRLGGKLTGLEVKPDAKYPQMWRIHYQGKVSDMVNLSRAKDAAITWLALPPKRGREHLHIKWDTAQMAGGAPPEAFR